MKAKRNGAIWVAVTALLAVGIFLLSRRAHFDWGNFGQQLRQLSWVREVLAVSLIYVSLWMRLVRWAVFCSVDVREGSARRVRPMSLAGPMAMGFTAVALFGRLADLVRPYLIARRLERPLSSQVAVYTIERMFDLGAAATVFSCALALTPKGLEHRERFVSVGVGSLLATLAIAIFAVAVRTKGVAIAAGSRKLLGQMAPRLGLAVEEKILGFQEGLRGIRTAREFGLAALLSISMWGAIGASYWQTLRSFQGTPGLASLSFSRAMLLMAVSLGGSLVQLPVVGWFTQIAVQATAIHGFYGAPIEAATACGALLLLTTSLSVLPAGLYFAWKDGVSLRAMAEESGSAGRVEVGR